ncbi:hypothetical protein OUZ56_005559 [Daphnia magna]|uniref:Uncharacterized protein n=1 Tax=Daphnia magna TaxID=35525 RepID=A0ABQ9YT39_9CRUS|nr:hypothetical protein OUZ56_005559 [Daphnia magna]
MFRELLGEEGGSRKSGKRAAEREEELEYRRTQIPQYEKHPLFLHNSPGLQFTRETETQQIQHLQPDNGYVNSD